MYNDIIFDIPCESGWDAPTEYCQYHYTFIIQNTHTIKKARENILLFLKKHYHDTGDSQCESSYANCILFDKTPYTYPNEDSRREDKEEYEREQKEIEAQQKDINFELIDDMIICENNTSPSNFSFIEYTENDIPPYSKSFEKAFDCSMDTECSAGLETISTYFGSLQEIGNKKDTNSNIINFNFRYFIGDGNDNMTDKTEVLEKIIQCDRFDGLSFSFYAVKANGELEYVGKGLKGAAKLFHITLDEILKAKESLASKCPDYASEWKKEQEKENIQLYHKYLTQHDQLYKEIKKLIFAHGAVTLTKKNSNQFSIKGQQYTQLEDFFTGKSLSWEDVGYPNNLSYKLQLMHNIKGQLFLIHNKRYPCFDSWDYAHEDRYYTTCILCDDIETANYKYKLLDFISNFENIPALLGPVLYYDSGKDYLAISKDIKIHNKTELFQHILEKIHSLEQLRKNAPKSPYH